MLNLKLNLLSGRCFHHLGQFLVIFSGFSIGNIAYSAPLLVGELPPPPSMNEDFSSYPEESVETIPYFEETPTSPDSEVLQREYNFQAPQPNYYSVPNREPSHATDKSVELYRVEVIAEDKSLLSQVREIEPFAYFQINGTGIYAGLFQDQQEAQKRVQQLINQGLSARIVPVNYSVSSSYDIPVQN
ncbi:hypothetical protein PCC7424_2219 [Gloeothece citriformis PCC 7424]|uniref:Sporulation domain protein n=1 Tax=Gloeothece citriformis (strain PCC 7424) TaxID=65393 RepID=B7KHE6_GLOC7|nr:hypothetical protein [Gloeothece citriformis]ACK70641.1 hypothetical protein PCC7424_2219 [Gloeothece citriformis PCC 7424]